VPYGLYKNEYETEEETRAQHRAVEPLMNEYIIRDTVPHDFISQLQCVIPEDILSEYVTTTWILFSMVS
jgi:hypothetical protein